MDEVVEVQWLQIWRLFVLIASENVAVMSALGFTPVRGGVVGGTVAVPTPYPTTVGAGRAAQAVPAAKSSARAIVVKSSSVFLMIFLSSHVFRALRDRFRSAFTLKLLSLVVRLSS